MHLQIRALKHTYLSFNLWTEKRETRNKGREEGKDRKRPKKRK